ARRRTTSRSSRSIRMVTGLSLAFSLAALCASASCSVLVSPAARRRLMSASSFFRFLSNHSASSPGDPNRGMTNLRFLSVTWGILVASLLPRLSCSLLTRWVGCYGPNALFANRERHDQDPKVIGWAQPGPAVLSIDVLVIEQDGIIAHHLFE